jgi:hypothetical protein
MIISPPGPQKGPLWRLREQVITVYPPDLIHDASWALLSVVEPRR